MNISPYTNLYEQQTVTVDRATLFPQSSRPVVDDNKLKQLDELLRENLDVDHVSHARNRRKRSSLGKGEGESPLHGVLEPTPFRLISTTNGPKIISLEPKPLPLRTSWEPPCDDNDLEAELRRLQALSAAVDVPTLLRSAQAYISRPQKAEKIIQASALLSSSCPSFFLAEIPRRKPTTLRLSHNCITRPSPHEVKLKGDALPMVPLKLQNSEQSVARPKQKRGRRTVEKPPAVFWRPLRRWGGKSSGYAMGYEGSWPVEHEHELRETRYVRDKMRKAVHVTPPSN